jgi:tetraacyldisaccharide 4'-kinase
VIISDDGLQHYALRRDIEIVVIDGDRRFGNGYCLPSGPLREPQTRIEEVDFVVVNGGKQLQEGEFAMQCQGQTWVNLLSGEQQPASYFQRSACHALAAIGNPNRFFAQIKAAGIETQNHPFPDHYVFTADDLQFNDNQPLLMTEKDAVKCVKFAQANFWYLPVTAQLPAAFSQQLLTLLKQKSHG